MGFSKATAKGRLDKYYYLAKEHGFRARSAFKLIQLNKKYNLLATSRCVVDLCAAPGGWLQVAKKYMPVSSHIIGIDLAPIKPITGVITMQEDITTDSCRARLRTELSTWKADLFLHDGAPNVGAAWAQDAYSQAELTLMALKLAVEFLMPGGAFVTKVFRSKDYNNLLWVFNQLFRKVEATKPLSSRNVSAEIFVVCRDFIAPKFLDPKFLDPKHVFQDLDLTESAGSKVNIFQPEKKRRQRDGYEEGNYTLHRKLEAHDFVMSKNPTEVLAQYNQISFSEPESQALLELPITTEDIKTICEDLKVLNRKDFKILLKWQNRVFKHLHPEEPTPPEGTLSAGPAGDQPSGSEESEEDVDELLEKLSKEEASRRKRARRRANERKTKDIIRMQLSMTTPAEIGMEQSISGVRGGQGNSLFNLKDSQNVTCLSKLRKGDIEAIKVEELDTSDEEEMYLPKSDMDREEFLETQHKRTWAENDDERSDVDELEQDLDDMYEEYKERQMKRNAKQLVQRQYDTEEFTGFDERMRASDSDSDSDIYSRRQNTFSESDIDSSSDEDERDSPRHSAVSDRTKRRGPLVVRFEDDVDEHSHGLSKGSTTGGGPPTEKLTKKAALWFNQPLFNSVTEEDASTDEDKDQGTTQQGDEEDIQKVPSVETNKKKRKLIKDSANEDQNDAEERWLVTKEDVQVYRKREKELVTAEAMTLAHKLVNNEVTTHELVDQGFSRWTFNDTDGLPRWFVEEERQHCVPNIPVTKEALRLLRSKMQALDARPIKKVAEAKARKKRRAATRLAKLQKQANNIADNEDMTEREKSSTINKLMTKQIKKQDKKATLVVARGSNRGLKGRPKGVKGRYKMVDARMKKELRAIKRQRTKK
ncbi:AdoMet-dependent rRNA methyltransferase spb1 [Dispira simplex]|nr:AdoMet-dependent rRNA methyltransferase spb1 [Dispira simplex]